jgi:hypothetical protein
VYKIADNKRTRVTMTYFTPESADTIVTRLESNGGRMQDEATYYVENVTIVESRTVKYSAKLPLNKG